MKAMIRTIGTILTLIGWAIIAAGLLLRIIGTALTGSFIVTRGLVRAIQAARA